MSYIPKSLKESQQDRDRIGVPRFGREMIDTPSALDAGLLQPSLITAVSVSEPTSPERRVIVLGNEKGRAVITETAPGQPCLPS